MKIPKSSPDSANRRRTDSIKEKAQMNKRSTKHTHKTKDRVTGTPLINWVN